MRRRLNFTASGQAMTEYLLVFGLIALTVGAGLWLWKPILAKYLLHLAAAIVQAR